MKKRPILAITALLLFSLLLASLYFLERRPLQDRLLDYVEQTLGVKATVGDIGWRWLPVPAVTIDQLKAETESFTLVVPQAHLTLSPNFFISGKMSLARAKLIKPELIIKADRPETALSESRATPSPEGAKMDLPLKGMIPADHLSIVDGTLKLPERALGQDLMTQAVTMSDINGTLSSSANAITFDIRANSDFGNSLDFKGSIDLLQGAYRLEAKGADIDSNRLFSSIPARQGLSSDEMDSVQSPPDGGPVQSPPEGDKNLVLPSVTNLNFSAHLEGQGVNRFQLRIGSNDSPLTLKWQNQTFQIAKIDGISLNRHDDDFSVDIKEIALAEPRLRLNGRVARQLKSENTASLPEWTIDLSAAAVDLAAVRAAVLANFGENPTAQKVCAIVRGGSATTARFAFAGGIADFQHLQNMQIWADTKDIPITLPTIDLSLDQASGPIAIIKGQLTGKNLTATIDKSHGVDGDLLLDLEQDEHGFRLDIDLDVDLQNLRDVLARIIPSHKFQDELSRFTKINGQAQGHLRLGDDIRQIKTEVEAHNVEASGVYDRLPWPFTISEGIVEVSPQQVAWEDVRGAIGAQKISRSTGSVSWPDDISATINSLDADLDLKSLFEDGKLRINGTTLALRDFARGRLDELSGQARLSKSAFSGPLKRPKQWQFHTAVACRDLKVARSGMPELYSQNVEAEINQQNTDFAGIFALLDQELFLSGHYDHTLFEQWHGDLEINGDIGKQLSEWIQEKAPFPAVSFLKTPFRVEKFIVTNQGPEFDSLLANGTIIPLPQENDIRLHVSTSRQNNQAIDTFTFQHGDKQGILSHQVWPDQEKRDLLTWQGALASETLDALFPQHFLQSGQIHGAFSRLTDSNTTTYSGSVEANGLRFLPESLTPELTIDTLRLRGDNNTITVDQADLAVSGTPAKIAGRVKADQGLHTLDLQVNAPQLSWKSIQKLFEVYNKRRKASDQEKSALDSTRGTIKFDIDAFDYIHQTKAPVQSPLGSSDGASVQSPLEGHKDSVQSPPDGDSVQSPLDVKKKTPEGEETSHTFTSAPFTGRMELNPTGITLQVDKSKVCGINGQGTWHFGNEPGDDTISFSGGQNPLYFEAALPCLGIKQSLIIGPFSLEGQISGRPKNWRQGSITLLSSEGLIKRMTLLSMIFTAVNFTDYLTAWHDLPDMKDEGLFYNELNLKAHVDNNSLILDRTVIKGKGVNLSGRGSINLTDLDSDLTFFIAPFKSLDWVVSNLPLVGKALAGPKESILTFPVAVTGNIKSPEVTALAPTAIGSAFLELFRDTMTLPFRIFQPEQGSPEQKPDQPKP